MMTAVFPERTTEAGEPVPPDDFDDQTAQYAPELASEQPADPALTRTLERVEKAAAAVAKAQARLSERQSALESLPADADDKTRDAAQRKVTAAENVLTKTQTSHDAAQRTLERTQTAERARTERVRLAQQRDARGLISIPLSGAKGLYYDSRRRTIVTVTTVSGDDGNVRDEIHDLFRVPYVTARIVQSDTRGGPVRVPLLLEHTSAGAAEATSRIVSQRAIGLGEWAEGLGMQPPTGRALTDAAAWVLREVCAKDAPLLPALAVRHPDGGVQLPAAEASPIGYGLCAGDEREAWAAWTTEIYPHAACDPNTALAMGSVIGEALADLLDLPPVIVNLLGPGQCGKSTTQVVSLSQLGDLRNPDQMIFRAWNASPQAIPNIIKLARLLPVGREEASSSGLTTAKFETIMSAVVAGGDRDVATMDGGIRASLGAFRSMLLSSSNRSLRRRGQSEDLAARLYELTGPFWTTQFVDEDNGQPRESGEPGAVMVADRVEHLALRYGGWPLVWLDRAGHLASSGARRWAKEHRALTAELAPGAHGLTLTHARVIACWVIGARIIAEVMGTTGLPESALAGAAVALGRTTDAATVTYETPGQQLLDVLLTKATDHYRFPTVAQISNGREGYEGELFGWQDSEHLHVLTAAHDRICLEAGIENPSAAMADLKERRILITPDTGTNQGWSIPRPLWDRIPRGRAYRYRFPDDDTNESESTKRTGLPAQPTLPGHLEPASTDPAIAAWVAETLEVIRTTARAGLLEGPGLTSEIDAMQRDGQLAPWAADQIRAARTARLRELEPAAAPMVTPALPPAPVADRQVPAGPPAAPRVPTQRTQQPARATVAPAYVVVGGFVVTAAGETRPAPASLPELLGELAAGTGGESSVVLLEPGTYGLTGSKPAPGKPWHKGFAPLERAGWHGEGTPDRRPHVGPWTNLEHPDRGTVRLCVLPWIVSDNPFPLSRAELDAGEQPEPSELIRRIGLLHSVIGQSYRGTRANTAVRLLRDLLAATTRGGARYQGSARITADMDSLEWTWDAPDVPGLAGDAPRVHGFDGNKNHLYPTREVRLCLSDLKDTGPIEYDPKLAGLFLIDVPEWPYPMLPAPTSQTGRAWVTAPILKRYARLGFEFSILASKSGPGVQPQATRRFVEIVAHALTELEREGETACAEAAKGLYQTLHGKLRSQSVITRYDWGLAIRDESWCNTLDKVYRIAGLEEASDQIRGAVPVYVDMDEIVYATSAADHAGTARGLGGVISIGRGLGQFKRKTDMSVSEWIEKREAQRNGQPV